MTDVPVPRRIEKPADLTALICEIKSAVAAGILEQLRPDPSPSATDTEAADLEEQAPWPDYIEMRFRVRDNGARYRLSAETYHGAGGDWGPE